MQPVIELLRKRSSLLLRLLVVGVIAFAIYDIASVTPTEQHIEIGLPEDHALATEVRVALLAEDDGALVRQIALRYPRGAPALLREDVEVAPGRYRVEVELRGDEGPRSTLEGRFEAPVEGPLRVRLHAMDALEGERP